MGANSILFFIIQTDLIKKNIFSIENIQMYCIKSVWLLSD